MLTTCSLRIYGWNGVSGRRPARRYAAAPRGQHFVRGYRSDAGDGDVDRKDLQSGIFPLSARMGHGTTELRLPVYAWEIERGQVFEFRLNHVVEVENGFELVRTKWLRPEDDTKQVGAAKCLSFPTSAAASGPRRGTVLGHRRPVFQGRRNLFGDTAPTLPCRPNCSSDSSGRAVRRENLPHRQPQHREDLLSSHPPAGMARRAGHALGATVLSAARCRGRRV